MAGTERPGGVPPRELGRVRGFVRLGAAGAVRMGGFGASMALLAVSSVLMIPAMIQSGGLEAWASIVTGQAIGSVAATVIGYGYGVVGASMIARADAAEARSEYLGSLLTRSVVAVPTIGIVFLLSALLPGPNPLLVFQASLPVIFGGFTAMFFYVGRSAPFRLLVLETVPRFVFTMLGVWVMVSGGSVYDGISLQLAGAVVSVLASTAWILQPWRRESRSSLRTRPLVAMLREQWHALFSTLLVSLYGSLPVLLVGMVAPGSLAAFGVFNKLQRQLAVAISPVSSVFQGWVPRRMRVGVPPRRAMQTALTATAILGALIAVAFLVAGDRLFAWLSAGQMHADPMQIALIALVIAAGLFQSCLSYACLIPLGGVRSVAVSTSIGIVVGLGLLLVLTAAFGVTGALVAILTGVVLQIVLLMVSLVLRLRAWEG